MRWDYQERDVNEIFSLWAVRPDGSGSDGFYKVHVPKGRTIQALRDPKPIEGHQLLVAVGSGHYSWCEGTLALCDLTMGINDANGITDVCPQASLFNHGTGETQAVPEGGVPYLGGLYAKPHGLSDKSFFVSASYDNPVSNNHAAYYVDVWGNKELIRRHHLMEVMCVVPVKQRQRPPVIPSMRDESVNHATCYVDNVYNDLPGIEAGQVKYIRICQQMFWIRRAGRPGLQWHPLSNASECFGYGGTGGPVRVVGTVPVEKDGSAKFQVPSGIDLYFQALDENYMSLQRMRTHVEFAPGENRGCIGCHETRSDVVPVRRKGLAMAKDAVRPTPPPWGDTTLINYEKMIQPIFEAKCVKCHGPEDPKAGLDLSAKKDKYGFMQSYRSLFGLKASDETPRVFWDAEGNAHRPRKRSHDHPWWDKMFQDVIVRGGTNGRVTEPKQFGAHKCPLTLKFVTDAKHRKLLTEKEMQLLSCWVDVQVPYFDTYMQSKGRRGLVRVKVTPHPPFGDSREHDAEYFGK
jgi:hypothetical protein